MKPPPFAYHRPDTVEEAVSLLAEYGDDAKVLAGGQSLMPMLNLRLAAPAHLIDIMGIPELAETNLSDGSVRIGAAVRQAEVEDSRPVGEACPLLKEALPHVAHREIRNAGTVCGSAAHADPAAEVPTVALGSAASFEIATGSGTRTVPADDFYTGYLSTAVAPDELLLGVVFPRPAPRSGSAFLEVAQRQGDYALGGIAANVTLGGDTVATARLSYLGLGMTPTRALEAERMLVGNQPTGDVIEAAANDAARTLECIDTVHASANYRRRIVKTLTRRALATAVQRATSHSP